jgi:signal recognition particle receptor subunit beta
LPAGVTAESQQYRASDDPSKKERQVEITDTPGHGKLRQHAYDAITATTSLNGLIFVVDAAALSSPQGLSEAATYLHDILLVLQKRHTGAKSSKGPAGIPVLIAANKLDLFTALPAQLVKKRLEDEITKIRSTRAKGLLDEDREWLGEGGEGSFNFGQMKEAEIEVSVLGGNASAKGEEKTQADAWWAWIAQQM